MLNLLLQSFTFLQHIAMTICTSIIDNNGIVIAVRSHRDAIRPLYPNMGPAGSTPTPGTAGVSLFVMVCISRDTPAFLIMRLAPESRLERACGISASVIIAFACARMDYLIRICQCY